MLFPSALKLFGNPTSFQGEGEFTKNEEWKWTEAGSHHKEWLREIRLGCHTQPCSWVWTHPTSAVSLIHLAVDKKQTPQSFNAEFFLSK